MRKITKQSKVTLVELPPTQFGEYNGEGGFCVFDRFGLIPSRALPTLEAVARQAGFGNVEQINPLFDGAGGKMTPENEARSYGSDVLAVSSITRTSPQSMELLGRYKLKNPGGIAVAGGPDPTFRPEKWLEEGHADVVVMKEGDRRFPELLERLEQDPEDLSGLDGVAWKKNGQVVINPPEGWLSAEELSQLPHPIYNKRTRTKANIPVLETIRGCPNACNFCSVTTFYGGKYRMKGLDHVLEGLRDVRDIKGMSLFFTDDNLTASPRRTIELCDRIVDEGLARGSCAQSTVKVTERQDVLDALKRAGIKTLYIGLESINDASLEGYDKPYSAQQNKDAIEIFAEQGLWGHVMFMPGGEGDTPESLREDFEWCKENVHSIQFMPPTALPGTKFYDQMKSEGRILRENSPHLYDVQHVVVRPAHFTPYELQTTINGMYEEFYSPREFARRTLRFKTLREKMINVALAANLISNRAIQRTLYGPQELEHLEFLKSLDKNRN